MIKHRTDLHPTNAPTAPGGHRGIGLIAMSLGLLFVSAMPDAMVVPVLHELIVDRYDIGVGAAHAFMSINLLGALMVVGLIGALRKRRNTGAIIGIAALLNAILLGLMALPIGFGTTLVLRFAEGAADLAVYALLFDLIARAGPPATKGRRMGAAATSLMLGIATGIGVGGMAGGGHATAALWMGALACLVVAGAAGFLRGGSTSTADASASSIERPTPRGHPLWPALVMMFSDRAVTGVLVSTVPLFFASNAGFSARMIGGLIGLSMLMTALGAWPAGRLADRVGALRLRLASGMVFALGFGGLTLTGHVGAGAIAVTLVVFGAAGAALFASSLLLVGTSGHGAAGMAAYHTAGNLGFLLGPVVSGGLLELCGEGVPSASLYGAIIIGFAILHASATLLTCTGLVRFGRGVASVRPVVLSYSSS